MSGKGVEVAIKSLDIYPTMHNALTAINHNDSTHRVRLCDNLCEVRASTERIRCLRNRHNFCALVNKGIERIEFQCATIINRNYSQLCPLALRSQLPRHDVRVVLDMADYHIVAIMQKILAPARSHQVQGHRSTQSKYHLLTALRTDKLAHHLSRLLVSYRHLLRQQMHATMYIGVIVQE